MSDTSVTINVEGMSCGHCSGMVQRTLEEIKGITNVVVDLEGKSACFSTENDALIDEAIQQVTEAGYKASR